MLAVIIPAYKATYLEEALESLAVQTCKNFKVYIGDDNSPNELKTIVDKFASRLDIYYKKFEDNIGAENLVYQWRRCIELSKDESWLWLFSDDDIADSKAVENFYSVKKQQEDKFDVYRFNTAVIDAKSKIQGYTPTGPAIESAESMAYNLLLGNRGNSMPDHIFSRAVYERKGGFVYTKFAQAADWATSILFAEDTGICIIPESKLYWRLSGVNISSIAAKNRAIMIYGHLQFIQWISSYFKNKKLKDGITYDMLLKAARLNLKNILIAHYKGVDNYNVFNVIKTLVNHLYVPLGDAVKDVYKVKRETHSRLNWLVKYVKKAVGRS